MAKDGKKALVPKLRFPEFLDAPQWENTTIGELGDFYYGKSAPKWSLEIDALTPCVRYGELYTKFGAVITETYSRTNIAPSNLRFSKGGEILIPRVGEKPEDFGKCCSFLPLANVAIGEMISVFETKEIPLFYTYYFRHLYKEFAKVVEGQNVKNLYYVELEPLKIFRPSRAEQQKIADCLSSLDELIATQGRKVEALKIYKRGLMQQLFPREGETLPRLRFPEFRDAPEWEEQTLRSICNRIMDGTHFSPKSKEGPRPYLTSKNIRNGHIDLSTISYISEDEHREIYTRCPVKKDDILLTKDGANTGNCAINTLDFEFSLLSSVAVLRGDAALVKQNFLYQTITSERTQSNIINSMSGQAITRITLEKLGNYIVSLPNLAEQQRIAEFLSLFDTQITAEADKFAALKTHKNGLMQQLFPSMEET